MPTKDKFEPTSEVLDNGDVRAEVGENQILVTHVSEDIPIDEIVSKENEKEDYEKALNKLKELEEKM